MEYYPTFEPTVQLGARAQFIGPKEVEGRLGGLEKQKKTTKNRKK